MAPGNTAPSRGVETGSDNTKPRSHELHRMDTRQASSASPTKLTLVSQLRPIGFIPNSREYHTITYTAHACCIIYAAGPSYTIDVLHLSQSIKLPHCKDRPWPQMRPTLSLSTICRRLLRHGTLRVKVNYMQ
jgi:hypothetical protein